MTLVKKYYHWVILQILIVINGYYILQIPDVPHWDEWDLVFKDSFLNPANLKLYMTPHGEHIIIPTRLIVNAFYHLNGLNYSSLVQFGFIVYLFALWSLYKFMRPIFPSSQLAVLSLLPFLSTLAMENLTMGMQCCIHMCLGFFALSWWIFFKRPDSYWFRGLQAALLFLAALSFAAGVGYLVAGILIFSLASFGWFGDEFKMKGRNIFSIILLSVFLTVCLSLLVAIKGLEKPPFNLFGFLNHYVAILAFGLGVARATPFLLFLGLGMVLAFLFLVLKKSFLGGKPDALRLRLTILLISVCSSLLLISFGRWGFGVSQAKSLRYSELALPLFGVWVVLLAAELSEKPKWMRNTIIALILILTSGRFKYSDYESDFIGHRRVGLECLKKVNLNDPIIICETSYPGNMKNQLMNAIELKLSFTKDLFPLAVSR